MCNNNSKEEYSSIAEILKVILVLQQNANGESSLDSCDRPTLGGGTNCIVCNTRPIMLYTCCGNGTPWSMPLTKDNANYESNINNNSYVFRVEKLEGSCVTCRVLAANMDNTSMFAYVATNSFFTFDLKCCCCLRCLNDTYVECV